MFQVNSEESKQNSVMTKKILFISPIVTTTNKFGQKIDSNSNPHPLKFSPLNPEKNKNIKKASNNLKKPAKKILFKLNRMNSLNNQKEKNKQKQVEINDKFQIQKKFSIKYKNNKKNLSSSKYSTGRWLQDEHQRFIDGVIKYGNNWRSVQKYVGTRTSAQTRSHAQKFFDKLKRTKIFKNNNYDFSKNSLKLLHDIMKNLSNKKYNQILKKLHSLSYKIDFNNKNEVNEKKNELNNGLHISFEDEDRENIDDKQEENIEKNKFNNYMEYCYIENNSNNNNNKLYNYDYLVYNNNNEYISNKDCYNFEIRSRKGSDIFNNQRKNSLSELNDIKEQISNFQEYDDKINSNIDNNEEESINKQLSYLDYSFSQQSSMKISLEEKIIAAVN